MNEFDRGYEFMALEGLGAFRGMDSAEWINGVASAIEELYSAMDSYNHYKDSVRAQESLKGFLAEEWAFGTANVDAAVKRLPLDGSRLDSHALGSADVAFNDDLYQLKFLTDPKNIARKLATTLNDSYSARPKRLQDLSFEEWAKLKGFEGKTPDDLLYDGMKGLVPSDKLEDAKAYATKRIAKAETRGLDKEVERWGKVRDSLTDRIEANNGTKGRAATNAEMREKAIKVSNGEKLDPSDDGLTSQQLVENTAILKSALKAGASAAAISAALKIAPEIYRAIDYLIETGELDDKHLRSIGAAACDGAATGFVTGSATAAITAAAGKGMFGETIKVAALGSKGANVIAALVVLTVETCRDSYMVASGRMQPAEMASRLSQSLFMTVCGFVGLDVATIIAPEATIPALIGSLVGAAAGGLAFKSGNSCVMRICVDSGFTFFGLVEQSYEVPPALLRKLGLKAPNLKTARLDTARLKTPQLANSQVNGANLHSLGIAFNERGLVGVNKVGYTLGGC